MALHDDGTAPMDELLPPDPNLYFRPLLPPPPARRWWSRGRMRVEPQTFATPRYGPLKREPLNVGEPVERGITRIIHVYGPVCFEPPLWDQLIVVARAGARVHLAKVVQVLAEHLERLPPR